MSELRWTSQIPKEPGFYFWRDEGFPLTGKRRVIELQYDDLDPRHWGKTSEWAGPIEEPRSEP